MADAIPTDIFRNQLLFLLEETFFPQEHPGPTAYLDRDTGWFPTLEAMSAGRASRPTVPDGTTVAGHVEHSRYYLEVVRAFARGERPKPDWSESWRAREVDARAWEALRGAFREAVAGTLEDIRAQRAWGQDALAGAMGALAHCAYHLGAVRQMLLVVR